MPAIADLKEELEGFTTLKSISSAFTEASAAKIKNIRNAFEKNKEFWEEISHVYHLVQFNAIKQKRLKKKNETTFRGKTISIALTSNQRFYGSINTNIINRFLIETEKQKTDLLVIGHTGIELIQTQRHGRPFKTMVFSKETPPQEELKKFLESLKEYTTIFVYYPKFVSLVTQTVGVADITQTASSAQKESEDEIHIIFEPELFKILDFFETQVRTLLFLRVILETNLSRTAARLISMSAAEERADELIKDKKAEIRKTKTSFINARLLETFTAMRKWKK